jgi:hypothetical protein
MTKHKPFFTLHSPNPKRDAARHLPGFETQEQAENERSRIIRILEARGAKAAAKALRRCCSDQPCGRAHCPVCNRHFRLWFIAAATNLIERMRK